MSQKQVVNLVVPVATEIPVDVWKFALGLANPAPKRWQNPCLSKPTHCHDDFTAPATHFHGVNDDNSAVKLKI